MKVFFLRFLFVGFIIQFFSFYASALERPDELRKYSISAEASKEFFAYFDSIKLAVTDPVTRTSTVEIADVNCANTIQIERHLGCSWYDKQKLKDMTGYNESVERLYNAMIKEFGLDCDFEGDTCMTSAEKIICTFDEENYLCRVEFYYIYPKTHPVPRPEPEEPQVPLDPNDPVDPIDDTQPGGPTEPGPFDP
ncbi:hypothetical protein CIK05_13835 [Bdellovibrio sp. qaytius]|nr:hypothetical protein CIK05_13835 [Bdellovibrio sp. qaytius]